MIDDGMRLTIEGAARALGLAPRAEIALTAARRAPPGRRP
jgi:hypothetical protein